MKLNQGIFRAVAIAMFATITLSSFAPAAFAGGYGRGKWKNRGGQCNAGYRGGYGGYGGQRVVIERRGSGWGPAVAGFIGGLAVGAIITDRAQANTYHARGGYDRGGYDRGGYDRGGYDRGGYDRGGACEQPASYYYEDPYCGQRYVSLNAYLDHTRGGHCGHWPIARVVDRRTGACEQTICWHDGGWHDYDDSDPDWNRRSARCDD